jgi:1,4-dihydroxy-2-naphthoate octaprenyltransferase
MNTRLAVRLVRLQFVPVIVAPVAVGTAVAWFADRSFQPFFFLLVVAGAVCLHVAANAIDDVYDYTNGVDGVSDRLFPKDAPGWKPIPRGLVSVGEGYAVASVFYIISLAIGVYLSLVVGWMALAIAVPGIILSWAYTAPPVKLDYRGLGLGEISVMLSFGPIPALGAYFVMARHLSLLPVVAAVPTGLLTASVLITHDLIFFDAYKASGKVSLAVMLGKRGTARALSLISAIAYLLVVLLVVGRYLPVTGLLVLVSLPLAVRLMDLQGRERSPEAYGSRTILAFVHSVAFSALLALGLLL